MGGSVSAHKDEMGDDIGPERIWVKNQSFPGLAMTRSFGDKIGNKIGVIATPDIIDYKLKEEDKIIIIASDGVWEFVTSKECIKILGKYYQTKDIQKAYSSLMKICIQKWLENEGVIDDITCIIIFLD
jgi:serine/threonine protein phosphatase PrpC